jgi:Zn-dependent protease with chaperone function
VAQSSPDVSTKGLVKTFLLPALLIFLIPGLTLAFFLHAQASYDGQARESQLAAIEQDAKLTPEEKQQARDFFNEVPLSRLIREPDVAADFDSWVVFDYKLFRWMIQLSITCLVTGVVVFLLAGVCVLLSLRSQYAQYVSLAAGWHVLRIYGAVQTLAQGVMLVALSYWVTALWFNIYIPKLIFLIAILALIAVAAVTKAIFTRISSDFAIEGTVVDRQHSPQLWQHVDALCQRVGTQPPDHIVLGIDDNFFVTEHPVIVDSKPYVGRTLFASLSLLKQLNGREADAVMAHELAHFSGQDTTYGKKISPLLKKYDNFLAAIFTGGITLPVYYFMLCFRGLFELSLSRLSRLREFRADKIAAEMASPRDMSGALLRIAAYSKYRHGNEKTLFDQERAIEAANISGQIETGFPKYAQAFAGEKDLQEVETVHPFDSHPPLADRLSALGINLSPEAAANLLAIEGDGAWFRTIAGAETLERMQWDAYENRFRTFHKEVLAYRYRPETEEERALVLEYFPEVRIEGTDGLFVIDYEKMQFTPWADAMYFDDVRNISLDDGVLSISHITTGTKARTMKLKKFGTEQQRLLDALNRYYVRHQASRDYLKSKAAEDAEEEDEVELG